MNTNGGTLQQPATLFIHNLAVKFSSVPFILDTMSSELLPTWQMMNAPKFITELYWTQYWKKQCVVPNPTRNINSKQTVMPITMYSTPTLPIWNLTVQPTSPKSQKIIQSAEVTQQGQALSLGNMDR